MHACTALLFIGSLFGSDGTCQAASASPPPIVDESVKPTWNEDDVPAVFKDMGVVQKRAMEKGGRFLLASYGSLDFSDGPYTNYSLNLNPGFALSDFFEIYFNFVAKYFVSPRSIVNAMSDLQSADSRIVFVAAKPLRQYGVEFLWAPAYGKDSLGIHRTIRSDTFLKLGVAKVQYETDGGLRLVAGLGKTYFAGRHMGIRFCINYGYLQTILNNVKRFQSMLLVETGLVFYL